MKKIFVAVLALVVISFSSLAQSQNDSIDMLVGSMSKNLEDLGSIIKRIKESPSINNSNSDYSNSNASSISIAEISTIRKEVLASSIYGITNTNLSDGDYSKSYDGYAVGFNYNINNMEFISPVLFNYINGTNILSSIKASAVWGSSGHKFYDRKWWTTKSFKYKTSVYGEKFLTNEYQIGVSGDYEWRYAHDFLSIGGKFDGGVYSPSNDSIMKSFLYAGAYASVFCLYGSVGTIYSEYIGYESFYKKMKRFIPIYELGIKTPDFKLGSNFFIGLNASYTNFGLYKPKVYMYDPNGVVVEDITKRVGVVDLYKGQISMSDHYGSSIGFGVSTWDKEDYNFSLSILVNLKNIKMYF